MSEYKSPEESMRESSALRERFTFSDPPEDEHGDDLNRRQFCLSCGATHFSEICPFCNSDAQDDL